MRKDISEEHRANVQELKKLFILPPEGEAHQWSKFWIGGVFTVDEALQLQQKKFQSLDKLRSKCADARR